MFELEVGGKILNPTEISEEVLAAFERNRGRLAAFSLAPWEEHCTECAMPACYTTCDLYAMRMDGKCRRFVNGMEIIPVGNHPQGFFVKIAFKRWGQLMAYANMRMIVADEAKAIERKVRQVQALAAGFPGDGVSILGRRGIPSRMARRWKKSVVKSHGRVFDRVPDSFLLEVFNPQPDPVRLSLTITAPNQKGKPPFQQLLEVLPGANSINVAADEIIARVGTEDELHLTLNPNILSKEEEGLALYFGLAAFVCYESTAGTSKKVAEKVKHVKVAVWDLDNTLWSGTLIEDGLQKVALRADAVAVVHELDRRGIVNSILSKNHPDEAMAAVRHFGLEEMFVFPQIGWGEKGAYMKELVKDFNVSSTTFAFIDDQQFERDQVVAANPGVRAYDSVDPRALLSLPEFSPPVSSESASRRLFYRSEEHRVREGEQFGGDYLGFLQTCNMRANVTPARSASFDRIQELVQRTNQLNYSGTHYSRAQIEAFLSDEANDGFVVSCVDNYGEYGTVGFVLVDRQKPQLRDAMFSCRIQFKRVEHAVITFLLHHYRAQGAEGFEARFNETKKNAAAAQVFADMGFKEVRRDGDARLFRFEYESPIPNDGIVSVLFEGVPWAP
jgi:FkbH-like protein